MNLRSILTIFVGLIMLIATVTAAAATTNVYYEGSEYRTQYEDEFVDKEDYSYTLDEHNLYVDDDVSYTRIQFRPIHGLLFLGRIDSERVSENVENSQRRVEFENHVKVKDNFGYERANFQEFGDVFPRRTYVNHYPSYYDRYEPNYYYGDDIRSRDGSRNYLNDVFRYGLNPNYNNNFRYYFDDADRLNDVDRFYEDQYGRYGWYRSNDGSRRYFV